MIFKARDNREFVVVTPLSNGLIQQLKAHSLNERDEALAITSDRERFGLGSYEKWLKKDRTAYALVTRTRNTNSRRLAALVWFGPESFEGAGHTEWHTSAWRSYLPFRGLGFMGAFLRYSIAEYRKLRPSAWIWAGVKYENTASQRLAESAGFTIANKIPAEGKLLMVLPKV